MEYNLTHVKLCISGAFFNMVTKHKPGVKISWTCFVPVIMSGETHHN